MLFELSPYEYLGVGQAGEVGKNIEVKANSLKCKGQRDEYVFCSKQFCVSGAQGS